MIFNKFFTPKYFYQNTKTTINEYLDFISTKNYLFHKPFILTNKNNLLSLYSFHNNLINIPENFYKNENKETKQFQFKSKSEILSRIIIFENKTKPHNEENQNEVKKLRQ